MCVRACVCACVCAQSASVCSKCVQISSLMFEPIAYFFPKKNKTLSLGFYSTHTLLYLPDDDLSKNAKFETRIAREHGATDERPISETDSKKNTKKNTKQQQHPRIRIKKSTTETTEERPTPYYAKTNRRHRDFKTLCRPSYILTMVRRRPVSLVFRGSARSRGGGTRRAIERFSSRILRRKESRVV